MPTKRKSSAAATSVEGGAPKKRERKQTSRRDAIEKAKRYMEVNVYGHVDSKVILTQRDGDNKLIEDRITDIYASGDRMSPAKKKEIVHTFVSAGNVFKGLELGVSPPAPEALDVATCSDNKKRSPDKLIILLSYCPLLSPQDTYLVLRISVTP